MSNPLADVKTTLESLPAEAESLPTKAVEDIGATLTSPTVTDAITNPFSEILIAILMLVVVIIFHGWCMGIASKFFSTRAALYTPTTSSFRLTLLTGSTISILIGTHFIATFAWTGTIMSMGVLENFRDAYYFVIGNYTTLGDSYLELSHNWRLTGPIIAISGLFTFGWTGSVLVYVMSETGKLHAERSRKNARDDRRNAEGAPGHATAQATGQDASASRSVPSHTPSDGG